MAGGVIFGRARGHAPSGAAHDAIYPAPARRLDGAAPALMIALVDSQQRHVLRPSFAGLRRVSIGLRASIGDAAKPDAGVLSSSAITPLGEAA